ncbi:MAG: class I SAM-dependent methyltransferase [Verrucomicrobium sp.]|nr:class I SAM-dependent methyltransferase [Verrucomicrobium sp.]
MSSSNLPSTPPSGSDDQARAIEKWGTQRTTHLNHQIEASDLATNEKNRVWWENLPMTYADWESQQREPVTKEDFDRTDGFYFGTNPYIREHLDFASLAGKRVLEIGCGAGSAACAFALAGASVTAVDITAQAVKLTSRNAELKGITSLDVRQMDAEKLDGLEDGTFDFVYSWGVLHHSSNPEQCYRQVARVLKPGGTGLIMVYHRNSMRYWLKGLYWLVLKGKLLQGHSFPSVQRFYTDGYYHKHYSAAQFRQSFQEAGLETERTAVTHMSSRMIPAVPEGVRQWLKARIGWLLVAHVKKGSS